MCVLSTEDGINNLTGDDKCWIMVYDDSGIIAAHRNSRQTSSKDTMESFPTVEGLVSRANELSYTLPDYTITNIFDEFGQSKLDDLGLTLPE